MEFKNKQAIYLQIADYVCDQILTGKFSAGDKMISVRDLAVKLEVNPNTILRAFEHLQQQGVIFNKRGIGYFVDETAPKIIREMRQKKFFEQDLPEFINKIRMLGIDLEMVKGKIG